MPASLHHPPHVYFDETWYLITASLNQGQRLLQLAGRKEILRDELKALVVEFNVRLAAWVILDNHYHILIKSRIGTDLSRLVARLHGRVSFELNKIDQARNRHVWNNYWDTCIRTEKDYWTRFNYVHHNPVKHGYVPGMNDWPFSSYNYYLEHKGEEWLADAFQHYPVIDFTEQADHF